MAVNFEVPRLWFLCLGFLCIFGFPCAGQDADALLERTGRTVELFWEQVPSFACTEAVIQEKIGSKGRIEYQLDSVFDYLALTRATEENLMIEELRLPRRQQVKKENKTSLLSTEGFPTLLLIFHPLYQGNYRFRIETGNEEDGALRIRFEHVPGMRSTAALTIMDRIYPLELQGTAWVDAETGAIRKISAGLVAPMKNINIENFRIEVHYKPQNFQSDPETVWLPSRAVIEVQTALQHWRNTHIYSQYKRFSVQSEAKISGRMNGD